MEIPVYLSTGAFTGKKNGRDYKLALKYADQLTCDGFEFLFFEDFYPILGDILREYRAAELCFPVIHAEKSVGDLLNGSAEGLETSLERFRVNCGAGAALGCQKIVLHAWGYPFSDSNPDWTCAAVARFMEVAAASGLELVVENVVCAHNDPLSMLEKLHNTYPNLHFLVDTRHAQFHGQLRETLDSKVMSNVHHFHLADYLGGLRDWQHRSAGLPLGEGDVDWPMFFAQLRAHGYHDTITIEASAILETGVDVQAQNRNIRFVRNGLRG